MNEYTPQTATFDPHMLMEYLAVRDGFLGPEIGIARLRAAFPFGEVFDYDRVFARVNLQLANALFGAGRLETVIYDGR